MKTNFLLFTIIILFVYNSKSIAQNLDGFSWGSNKQGQVEIKNNNNKAIKLSTNNVQRMIIDSSGNVGINNTSPNTKLEVSGKIKTSDTLEAKNIRINNASLESGSMQDSLLTIENNGNVRRIKNNIGISTITANASSGNITARDTTVLLSSTTYNNSARDTVIFNGVTAFNDTTFFNNKTTLNNNVSINSALGINPLAQGSNTDSMLVWNATTFTLFKRNTNSLLQNSISAGAIGQSPAKDSLANSIANAISNNLSGTKDSLVQAIAANINNSPIKDSLSRMLANSTQIANALHKGTNNDSVLIGGALYKATKISTNSSNNLFIKGLSNTIVANDSFIAIVENSNILKKAPLTSAPTPKKHIYNTDGLLTTNRNVFMQNKTIAFDTSTLFINPNTNSAGINTNSSTNTNMINMDVKGQVNIADSTFMSNIVRINNDTIGNIGDVKTDSVFLIASSNSLIKKIGFADLGQRLKESSIISMPIGGMLSWVFVNNDGTAIRDSANATNLNITGTGIITSDVNELGTQKYIDLNLGGIRLAANYANVRTVVMAMKYDNPENFAACDLLGSPATNTANFLADTSLNNAILSTNSTLAIGGSSDYFNTGLMSGIDPNLNNIKRESSWRIIAIRTSANTNVQEIGRNPIASRYADMKIAEVVLYDRVLNPLEIKQAAIYIDKKYGINGSIAGNDGVTIKHLGNRATKPNMVVGLNDNSTNLRLITNNNTRININDTGALYFNGMGSITSDPNIGAMPNGYSLLTSNPTNKRVGRVAGFNLYSNDGNLKANRKLKFNNKFFAITGNGFQDYRSVALTGGIGGNTYETISPTGIISGPIMSYITKLSTNRNIFLTDPEMIYYKPGIGSTYGMYFGYVGATPSNSSSSFYINCLRSTGNWERIGFLSSSAGSLPYPASMVLLSWNMAANNKVCYRYGIEVFSGNGFPTTTYPNISSFSLFPKSLNFGVGADVLRDAPTLVTVPTRNLLSVTPFITRFITSNTKINRNDSNYIIIGSNASSDGVFLAGSLFPYIRVHSFGRFRIGAPNGVWIWGQDSIESNNSPELKVQDKHIIIRSNLVINKDSTNPLSALDVLNNGNMITSGRLGVGGIIAPTEAIDANGNVRGTVFIISSDVRFKKNIITIDNALQKVLALEGKTYNFICNKKIGNHVFEDTRRQYGLIAQDLNAHLPELVHADNEGYLSIDYTRLYALLIESSKQQQSDIESIKASYDKLSFLEQAVAELKKNIKEKQAK